MVKTSVTPLVGEETLPCDWTSIRQLLNHSVRVRVCVLVEGIKKAIAFESSVFTASK